MTISMSKDDSSDGDSSHGDGVAPTLEAGVAGQPPVGEKKKRNRKKKNKNKTDQPTADSSAQKPGKVYEIPELDNSVFRLLRNWPSKTDSLQSWPPTVPVRHSPIGQEVEYNNSNRMTSQEAREKDKLMEDDLKNIRRAAEVHRNVRRYVQSYIRPGLTMIDICQRLEQKVLELVGTLPDFSNYQECGRGFPTGCSINHVAAHYTPNYGDKTVLQPGDICKLDFGVHVFGRIVDCAWTVAFDPKFDPLIQATQDGTNVGLKEAGIDARFGEIGAAIQEAIESYEFVDGSKTFPIKPIRNLNGHSMEPYRIHAGKSVPIVKNPECANERMEEGEFYAIETFASTGKGIVIEDMECSHYAKIFDAAPVPLRLKGAKQVLNAIDKTFGTLPFCRRWLDDIGQERHILSLKSLVDSGLVQNYPPLCDIKGSYTSQMEHTIVLKPSCKEIVSRGDDY